MNKRVIRNFEILIGQDSFRLFDPMMGFMIDDKLLQVSLKDFKQWIDDIVESNGNRSDKAYNAKRKLDQFFNELLSPYVIIEPPKLPK